MKTGPKPEPIERKFWRFVGPPNQNGCREWIGGRYPNNYGMVHYPDWRHTTTAQRVAWILAHGEIPPGLVVMHKCDNPPCCEHTHLRLGTEFDNILDAMKKDRLTQRKLTWKQVDEIRRLVKNGAKQKDVAARFNTADTNVSEIIQGNTWKASEPMTLEQVIQRAKNDIIFFCRLFLHFNPYWYQADFWKAAMTHNRVALLWGRGNGKTTAVAIFVVWWAFSHGSSDSWNPMKIVVASKSFRQSKDLFDTISPLITGNSVLLNSVTYLTRTEIRLTNGAWIIVVPTGTDGSTIRGKHPGLLILDEADYVKKDIIEGVIYPMLNIKLPDGSSKTLIMMTTPWGHNTPFRAALMDPEYWKSKVRSDQCPGVDHAWLLKQKLNNPYRYKIECDVEYPDDESAWLRQELLLRCSPDDYNLISEASVLYGAVETGKQYRHFVGVDLGKKESYSIITIFREEVWRDGKTVYRLIYYKRFPRLLDLPKIAQADFNLYLEVENHLKKIVEKFNVVWLGLDLGAAGEAFVEQVRLFYPGVTGIALSEPKKRDMASWMRAIMEQGRIRLPVQPTEIAIELNSEQYIEREGGMIHFYPAGDDKEHSPDDVFYSVGLALYGTHPVTTDNPPFGFAKL